MAAKSVKSLDYVYRPLESSNHIRLLHLTQALDDGMLQCDIIHVDLENTPPYLALSYVWGGSTLTHQILIGSQTLNITGSLKCALRDIQNFYGSPQFDLLSGRLLIWADAVSIDQNNLVEKSKQIPLMTSIYRLASAVITYIGPEDDETMLAVGLIELLKQFYHDHGGDSKLDMRARPDEELEALGLPAADHVCWAALRRLLRRPWSGRVWIVQESVVNEKIIMLCGRVAITEWDVFAQIVTLALSGKLPLICISGSSDAELDEKHLDIGPGHVVTLAQLRAFFWLNGSLNKSLYQLLRTCHAMASHDPRDKVYALLGLAKDSEALAIIPKYSIPVVDVFTETATKLLRSYPTLDMFTSVRGDKIINLPSWVPDWSSHDLAFGERSLLFLTHHIRNGLYQASCGLPSDIVFSTNGKMITVTGYTVDIISKVIQDTTEPSLACGGTREFDGFSAPDQLFKLLQSLTTTIGQSPYSQTCGVKEALWRTVIANVTDRDVEATADYEKQFLTYLDVGRRMSLQTGPVPIALDPESAALFYQFAKAVAVISSGRSFAVTSTGFFGVVPILAQPGDLICVLHGGCVPYVLRKDEDAKYTLIGDSYVHGVMKGEILDTTPVVENFTIV